MVCGLLLVITFPVFSLTNINQSLPDKIEKVLPAVVKIKAINQEDKEETGTGFIITSDGYLVTSQHLIEDTKQVKVKLNNNTPFLVPKKIGVDSNLDLALLKIKSEQPLPTVKLGNSADLRPGNLVIAIGHPYELDYTISLGIVSSTRRTLQLSQERTTNIYSNLIQTDAAINPGNSGGPLLNLTGEVIGINTAINIEGEGIGFAIPINEAKNSIEQIKEHGKIIRPWIGVYLQTISSKTKEYLNLDKDYGVLLSNITPDSPAAEAGLKSGDIILEFNGEKIYQPEDLTAELNKLEIGSNVEIKILRDPPAKTYTLTIKEQPKNIKRIRN